MTAANEVLELYELLEAILLYLPPSQITQAMRTSKTRHSVIQRSSCLQQRRILTTRPDAHEDISEPQYKPGETIRVHPILNHDFESDAWPDEKNDFIYFSRYVDPSDMDDLQAVMHEFACLPPLQKLLLRMSYNIRCTLYVKTGIRVRGIVKGGVAMWEGRKEALRDREDFVISGEFVAERIPQEYEDSETDSLE